MPFALAALAITACSVFGSSLEQLTEGGGAQACPSALDKCGESCVDTQSDPAHCGACGKACPSGQVCDLGACSADCSGGKTNCSGACVDLGKDPLHCGDCAISCDVGQACANGTCDVSCFPGQTECGGSCVDLQADDQHCGQCGNACPIGQKCSVGKCEVSCTTAQTLCDGACVDTQTSQAHCGACGNACKVAEQCNAGKCETACPGTQSACNGLCYDLLSDDQNCGSCGNACTPPEKCGNGQCSVNCPTGQTACGSSCVDLQTDSGNCSSCGNACGANQECVGGKCVIACKTLLNGTPIDDKVGYFWDGLERAATTFDQAKSTCEGVGGRLPTASELYRVSATQSATVGQTSNTNFLWSLVPYGPSNQIRVRLSDAATSTVAKTTSLNYRCVCPPPLPSAFVGSNCFGPSGSACYGLDAENKKLAIDAKDRPPLPKSSAIWECAFNRAHLASPARLVEAIKQGVGTGSNLWLHTSDDARNLSDVTVRWQDPKVFAASSGLSYATTTALSPFRCAGANYDAGTHPVAITDEFVGPLGGYKADGKDNAASAWAAAASACWARGGHVATATELAELVSQGLPGGTNAWLWGADESSVVLAVPSLQAYRFTGTTQPTYASGTDLTTVTKTTSQAFRCVYYPVDTTYSGPQTADCAGGCKTLALPGSSGAKLWFDEFDRAPAATLDVAFETCRAVGGHLPMGRDYLEAVRAGLANGSNAVLWSADFLLYRGSTTLPYELRGHVARWTASAPAFDDSYGTYASTSALTASRAYRCMWTNEIR